MEIDREHEEQESVPEVASESAPAAPEHRWLPRLLVLSLLIAGAVVVAVAAVTIVGDTDAPTRRGSAGGVVMPDDAHFRDVVSQLVARRQPEKLRGLRVVGAEGKVTVLRYRAGQPSFLSSYLNPNALKVIARSVGFRSNDPITVDELRLEVLRSSGRQRWRLRGTQHGAPWRATIAPNGTSLHLIPTKVSS